MKHYYYNGCEFSRIPDPITLADGSHVSPVNEAVFVALGGTIEDDGQPTPEEKFFTALNDYLEELEKQAEALALDITIDEFKAAAGSMMSSELIAWAKSKGVPDELIDVVRPQILTFIADASRLGLTWADIFPKVEVSE